MINDLLDFSRIEAGGLNLHTETLPLHNAISEVVNAIQPHAKAKGITLLIETNPNVHVSADQLRLRQVLYNLLNNAVKFTPAGGTVSVNVSPEINDRSICVTVSDTGIGIAKAELAHVFEKFYQVGVTAEGAREGTGLGLAICKQLIEMHGGRIWADESTWTRQPIPFHLKNTITRDHRRKEDL